MPAPWSGRGRTTRCGSGLQNTHREFRSSFVSKYTREFDEFFQGFARLVDRPVVTQAGDRRSNLSVAPLKREVMPVELARNNLSVRNPPHLSAVVVEQLVDSDSEVS